MNSIEGATCAAGHRLELVAEGYALCFGVNESSPRKRTVSLWRLSPPRTGKWARMNVLDREGNPIIPAWLGGRSWPADMKDEALAAIQEDIDAHRALPFDEAAERARLMEV